MSVTHAMITTIVSGGQTGVDRAAFDVALAWGIPIRGWVPRGRLAEDGSIPAHYSNLQETGGSDPAERTRLNVRDADGALIISHGDLQGGSLLAVDAAVEFGRPMLHVDLARTNVPDALVAAAAWIAIHDVRVLGVGGPRASEDPRIHAATIMLLSGLLGYMQSERST